MAMKHLGETIDIHAGGEDLQFPHHENEIAQSELATGTLFARYWMHVAFLKIDGKRMGKSEQNFILLRDALDNYPTEVIRHFLISAHYRHPLDYNQESLTKSEGALRRLNNCLDALKNYDRDVEPSETTAAPLQHAVQKMKSQFTQAMDTDFNTAQALGAIFILVGEVNKSLSTLDEAAAPVLAQAYQALTETCQVLGIYNMEVQSADGDNVQQRDQIINLLLEIRQDARNRKDWETSDKIRDRLKELNIEIKDTREGATWKIIS
jgi:cysteinyl-tRNA synthetase